MHPSVWVTLLPSLASLLLPDLLHMHFSISESASRNLIRDGWHLQQGPQGPEEATVYTRSWSSSPKPPMCMSDPQTDQIVICHFTQWKKDPDTPGALSSERQWQSHIHFLVNGGHWGSCLLLQSDQKMGRLVAQSVKRLTSAQVMISRLVSSSPALGSVLTAWSREPASDSVSPSFSLPLPVLCSVSLKNK